LEFTSADSGTGGFDVVYRAFGDEHPVISGGQSITGWQPAGQPGVWKAAVGPAFETRQLYVDGVRARRATSSSVILGSMTQTPTGYVSSNTEIQSWRNPQDIEFVYTGSAGVPFYPWTDSRCGVNRIEANASSTTAITMDQPCFANGQFLLFSLPTAVENAFEVLDEPGEWYLDRAEGLLYYMPRPSENLSTADVVAPVVETLVRGSGTVDAPIENLRFVELEFAYDTWLRPSTGDGFIEVQANDIIVGDPGTEILVPGSVTFRSARRVRIERCTFRHLGAQGLVFDGGSQHCLVEGCLFTDISGTGVRIGDFFTPEAIPAEQDAHNRVRNNLVLRIAAEFRGGVGFYAGYTADSILAHNEFAILPYSAISVGWGWGDLSYSTRNTIRGNRIHDIKTRLPDGGGIYLLGPQPDSVQPVSLLERNWIFNDSHSYGSIYFDEGSQGWRAHHNVVTATSTNWLYLQDCCEKDAIYNVVELNYRDTAVEHPGNETNVVRDNTLMTPGDFPDTAWSIMNGTGVQAGFSDLAPEGVPRNVAVGKPSSASTTSDAENGGEKANDGDPGTGWLSESTDPEATWQVDLGHAYQLHVIQILTRQDIDDPEMLHNFEIRASNNQDMSQGYVVLGTQGASYIPYQDTFTIDVLDQPPYRYVAAVKTAAGPFGMAELRVYGTGGPAANPKEASPSGSPMSVARNTAGDLIVDYTPGCGATDHAIWSAQTPIRGQLEWTRADCYLGTSGQLTFDPGAPPPGEAIYFVVVGQNDVVEGSYGLDSEFIERPEANGVGICDLPRDLSGICP
ncbi:MAG TPA: hypothetical protein ENK10_08610, partial [Acidobacteria bacterium]|nr:hypothetical protein [Acidobacteriota bacterium]